MNIAQRIESLLSSKDIKTIAELERICKISNGTIGKWGKNEYNPSMRILEKISAFFGVPADFLRGIGIFENWDIVLEHRNSVIKMIAGMMHDLSLNLRHGVSDATLVWLVGMFNIHFEINEYGRPEFGGISPFGTFDTDMNYPENKNLTVEAHEVAVEFMNLSVEGRRIVWGKIYEEKRRMTEEFSSDFLDFTENPETKNSVG